MSTDPYLVRQAPLAIAAVSAAMLGAALLMQYVGGLPPCALCHWQRYAYVASGLLGLAAWFGARRVLIALAGVAFLIGAGIAVYHAGVEWKIFAGPSGCTGTVAGAQTIEELRRQLTQAPVIRCDEAAWTLFGISIAGYNALIGAALGVYAFAAAWRTKA
jgi:disulfide bond formation protein DsbB